MEFAVIGGDARQAKLTEMLAADGHTVRIAGLERAEGACAERCVDVREALVGSRYVILPLPAVSGDGINMPLSDVKLSVRELTELLEPEQTVFAGKIEGELRSCLRERGIGMADYFEREELTIRNAAATAEGAVQLLMQELPTTLAGAKVLVIGFGRIGKLLALKLRALNADVTVSARRFPDFAWIEAMGFKHADTRRLRGTLKGYATVVNTAPALVLDEELLTEIDEGALCLDLASKPGGIDFTAAQRLGVRVIWALSLPGQVAPVTSGAAIKDAIYNIISELECVN